MSIEKQIIDYPRQYNEGFTHEELQKVIKLFPDVNVDVMYKRLRGDTCVLVDGKVLRYPHDIVYAVREGLGEKVLYFD